MSKPYTIYLASKPISEHETFTEALAEYSKHIGENGVNMRNGERSDVDYDGITDDERIALDIIEITHALSQRVVELEAATGWRPIAEAECGFGKSYLVWNDNWFRIASYGIEFGQGGWFDNEGNLIPSDAQFMPLPPPPEPKP